MAGLFTVTQIAERLQERGHRVTYMISKLNLKPVSRVGIIRLFDEQQIEAIRNGLYNLRIQREQ